MHELLIVNLKAAIDEAALEVMYTLDEAALDESCYLHELLIVHHPIARWVLYTGWLRKMTQFVSQHDSSCREFVEVTWRIYSGWLRKIILHSLISWVNTTHLVRSSWWRVRAGKMTHLVISCTFPTWVDTTHLVVMTHEIILHNFISWVNTIHLVRSSWWRDTMTHLVVLTGMILRSLISGGNTTHESSNTGEIYKSCHTHAHIHTNAHTHTINTTHDLSTLERSVSHVALSQRTPRACFWKIFMREVFWEKVSCSWRGTWLVKRCGPIAICEGSHCDGKMRWDPVM